jgi:hypothetical protein
MSSSWNFLAWAEPSWKGSKPSQAELGHFNFRTETELTIKKISAQIFFFLFFFTKIVTLFTLISVFFVAKTFSSKNGSETGIFLKIQWKTEKEIRAAKNADFRANFWFPSWEEKVTSQAELKILQLELWL